MYDGILNINKPARMTSFDVVSIIRKLTGMKKVGHTGTLDPDAEGVLVLCVGEALKCVEYMMNKDKEYIAKIKFGTQTDTQDSSGQTINSSDKRILPEEMKNIVDIFQGKQNQTVPIYSAIKVKGKKYCDIVRKGLEIEGGPKEREIEINKSFIETFKLNDRGLVEEADIYIHCSKGTYIRTICNDIGVKAGTCAHMSHLKRIRAGNFKLEDSISLDGLKNMAEKGVLSKAFIPKEYAFNECRKHIFDNDNIKRITNGIQINLNLTNLSEIFYTDEYIRIYNESHEIRAIGKVIDKNDSKYIKGYRIFSESN